MPTALPSEITHLASVVEKFAALHEPADFMRHHDSFRAAHGILRQETDSRRRREYLDIIHRNLPPEGLGRIMGLSFLAAATQDAAYLRELHEILMRPPFTLQQRHFFYWQLLTRHSGIRGEPTMDPAAVYFSLLDSYRRSLNIHGSWIEPAARDSNTIVVITNQLLGMQHAPTADCLDYCHILQASLKKKVYLINTGDMPWTLPMPYYDPVVFGHAKEYSAAGKLPFRGETIDFYQCRKPMPNLEEIDEILRSILSLKPSFILNLGHSNVTADLCAEFLTVATMPFGTDLPRAASNLFLLPRKRKSSDAAFMEQWQISEEQIIETQYTFRLPDRSETLTREELGLPVDDYVIAVVGNRLDDEVDDAFAEEASELLRHLPKAFIAFMGQFSRFGAVTQKYPVLERRSAYLGHRKDILAAYECCNAYWNPPRYGGGSSAAFALALGLPVFTGAAGDVASIAGPGFLFPSWRAIKDHIEKSLADPVHRDSWEKAAKMRFREISDRKGMLEGILANVAAKAAIRKSSR